MNWANDPLLLAKTRGNDRFSTSADICRIIKNASSNPLGCTRNYVVALAREFIPYIVEESLANGDVSFVLQFHEIPTMKHPFSYCDINVVLEVLKEIYPISLDVWCSGTDIWVKIL